MTPSCFNRAVEIKNEIEELQRQIRANEDVISIFRKEFCEHDVCQINIDYTSIKGFQLPASGMINSLLDNNTANKNKISELNKEFELL